MKCAKAMPDIICGGGAPPTDCILHLLYRAIDNIMYQQIGGGGGGRMT